MKSIDEILVGHLHEIKAGHDEKLKAELLTLLLEVAPDKRPVGKRASINRAYNKAIDDYQANIRKALK